MINSEAVFDSIDSEVFDTASDEPPPRPSLAANPAAPSESRPGPFDRVVGQSTAVELLRRISLGVTFGGEPDPILLQGPSGRGKTLLASRFAEALSLPMVTITCGREVGPAVFVELISALPTPAVVFLDEVHSLPKKTMEVAFGAIDNAALPAIKHGAIDRTVPPVRIARHVWVAASNMPGGILRALRSRLVTISLADYSHEELEQIGLLTTESLDIELTPDALALVARACGGSPRRLGHLLKTIAVTTIAWRYDRDYENADSTLDLTMVQEVVDLMGLDSHGLDATGRQMLAVIAAQLGGSASAETVSVATGLDLPFVRERLAELRGRGFVAASPGRGWSVLPRAARIVSLPIQES